METTTSIPEMLNTTPTAVKILPIMDPNSNVYSFRYFGLAIGFWTAIVGTIGNTLTILTYVANKKLRTTFNLLLLNLAVVDFFSAILMLPFHMAGYFQLKWPFGNDSWTARLQAFNYFCCGYTSIVFLVVITVNRFIGAVFPGRYKDLFCKERMIWLLVISHLFAPVFLLPFLVGTDPLCKNFTGSDGLTGFRQSQLLCTFTCLPPKSGWLTYMQFTRVLFQFIPLIFMIIMYALIFFFVHSKREGMNKSISRVFKSNQSSSGRSTISSHSESKCLKKDRSNSTTVIKRRQEDKRMLAISVAICVGFMVTFLPSVIVNLLPNRATIDIRWHMAASNLAWLNSSLNPLIYVVLNRRFRKEVWRILRFAVGSLRERFIHENSTTLATVAVEKNSVDVNAIGSVSMSVK